MGIAIKGTDGVFPNPILKKFSLLDRRLHNGLGDGALWLIDAVHSVGGLGTEGLPAGGAVIPNIVRANLESVSGISDAAQLDAVFTASFTAASMTMERTPKHMLHGAFKQSGSPVAGAYARIVPPLAAIKHMSANPLHRRLYFLAGRITRTAVGSKPWAEPWAAIPVTSNQQFLLRSTEGFTAVDYASITPGPNSAGAPFLAIAIDSSPAGTPPSGASGTGESATVVWGAPANFSDVTTTKPGSFAFASSGCIDLTAANVADDVGIAAISEWFEAEFLTNGGKYYGDTPTDPNTLAGG